MVTLQLIGFQIGGEELERAHVAQILYQVCKLKNLRPTFRLGTELLLVELCGVFLVLLDIL